MKTVCVIFVILGLSVEILNAQTIDVLAIFNNSLQINYNIASKILEDTKKIMDSLKQNPNVDFINTMNNTLTAKYSETVKSLSNLNADCLTTAKSTTDDLIENAIEEFTSCQQLTQAADKVQTMGETSGLEKQLTVVRDEILADARKCTRGDFMFQLNCMQRKAKLHNPSMEDLTKKITSNMHEIGGLSLLVQIEFGSCQNQENDKLPTLLTKVEAAIKECVTTTS